MQPWICFEWEATAADLPVTAPASLTIRAATRDEKEIVGKVLLTAFSMDSAWGDISRRLNESMERFVEEAFAKGRETPSCVVAQHGPRIIGVSVMNADPNSPNHLPSGPMILHEYRNRGLGTALLAASLEYLRALHSGSATAYRALSGHGIFRFPKAGDSAKNRFYAGPFRSIRNGGIF